LSVNTLTATAISFRVTPARLAALTAAAVIGGIGLTSSPAQAAIPADRYDISCQTYGVYEVCVSYDYTDGYVSSNFFNGAGSSVICSFRWS